LSELLLERAPAVAAIEDALARLRDGVGGLVLLEAPAGAGKSRLLEEVVRRAGPVRVLRARCSALEVQHPFSVPLALFGRLVADRTRAGTPVGEGDLFEGAAGTARDLFASVGSEPHDPLSRLHGLFWLTVNLAAAEGPLVALVDDAHWSDAGSLRFLSFLAARLDDVPVLLVVARRPDEVEGERGDLLERLFQGPRGSRLPTPALSPTAVTTIVRNSFPGASGAFCRQTAAVTGGNPFLVSELVSEMRTAHVDPRRDDPAVIDTLGLADITRAVSLRLRDLAPPVREVAVAVAVLGSDVEPVVAARVSGLPAAEVAAVVDPLLRAGLATFHAGRLEIAHPLLQAAVLRSVGDGELALLRSRAAVALRSHGAPPATVAAQLLGAARCGETWVVEALREAARSAVARGAPESAASYLERALAEPPPPERRVELLTELGRAELLAARGAAAVGHLTTAAELAADPSVEAAIHNALGRAHYLAGDFAAAASSFAAGADPARGADPEQRLRNEADLISAGILAPGLLPELAERLPAVVEVVLAQQPRSAAGRAILGSAALMAVLGGRPASEAIDLAERSFEDGRLLEEEGPEGQTIYSLTGVFTCCDQLARSVEILDRAVDAARRHGSVPGYITASYARAEPQLRRGRPSEAIADARTALESEWIGWRQYLPSAYSVLIRALVEVGDLDEAGLVVAAAEKEDWTSGPAWGVLYGARGDLRMAQGDVAGALEDYRHWGRFWPVPNPAMLAEWRSSAATALVALGRRDEAVRLAEEELGLAAATGIDRSLGVALRALGLAQGDDRGVRSLESAREHLSRSESVLERVRTLVALGGLLRRLGRRNEAQQVLGEALVLADRHGLRALAARAGEELLVSGGSVSGQRDRAGADALTPGELRVARMAVDGLSNSQIAQALFVTRKAVEWHLGNAYRKLGITGHGALADALDGQDGRAGQRDG